MNTDDNTRIGNPNRGSTAASYAGDMGQDSEKGTLPRKRLDIGQAIAAAKAGERIARKGWNSSYQYVYYIPAASYPAQTQIARGEFGNMVPYREYLALKTAQDDVATWAPSCSDALATDWYIVKGEF